MRWIFHMEIFKNFGLHSTAYVDIDCNFATYKSSRHQSGMDLDIQEGIIDKLTQLMPSSSPQCINCRKIIFILTHLISTLRSR